MGLDNEDQQSVLTSNMVSYQVPYKKKWHLGPGPIFDIMEEFFHPKEIEYLIENNKFE